MQKKIRTHTLEHVPFLLIAGEKDRDAGAISFRFRDGTTRNGVPVDEAIDLITGAIEGRLQVSTADDLEPAGGAGAARRSGVTDAAERRPRDRRGAGIEGAVGVPDAYQRLWVPHRMAYIPSNHTGDERGEPRTTPARSARRRSAPTRRR